nr:hypothetical protein [Allomuricauda sp.]
MANKIKINNDLWFTVLGNKLIFGSSKKQQNYHHTISYGNNSGYFDLHLKNEKTGKYFTVFTFSHQNLLEIMPQLFYKVYNSILDLRKIEKNHFKTKEFEVFEIDELGDLTEELGILTKKNRIQINQDSDEFRAFVDLLLKKHKLIKVNLEKIADRNQFHGIAKSPKGNYFLIKSPYLGNDIFILNNIDLEVESVLRKILGDDVFGQILERIKEGIIELKKQ